VTATQGGADQQGEAVALSGKELGDEVRRTPRGFGIWRQMKEPNDPVKREIGRQNRATQDEKLAGRLGNRSRDLNEGWPVRASRKSKPGEEGRRTRQGDSRLTTGRQETMTSSEGF
jgi:hypothetical protein